MAEAWGSLHLTLHFTHALSRLPLSRRPLWERWACFFAVMAPSGPAHINQSHINQGQGRNR